jgi:hypothetical protein
LQHLRDTGIIVHAKFDTGLSAISEQNNCHIMYIATYDYPPWMIKMFPK